LGKSSSEKRKEKKNKQKKKSESVRDVVGLQRHGAFAVAVEQGISRREKLQNRIMEKIRRDHV